MPLALAFATAVFTKLATCSLVLRFLFSVCAGIVPPKRLSSLLVAFLCKGGSPLLPRLFRLGLEPRLSIGTLVTIRRLVHVFASLIDGCEAFAFWECLVKRFGLVSSCFGCGDCRIGSSCSSCFPSALRMAHITASTFPRSLSASGYRK